LTEPQAEWATCEPHRDAVAQQQCVRAIWICSLPACLKDRRGDTP
jgi:hypothetical protein